MSESVEIESRNPRGNQGGTAIQKETIDAVHQFSWPERRDLDRTHEKGRRANASPSHVQWFMKQLRL
jgi:hypothetical protein